MAQLNLLRYVTTTITAYFCCSRPSRYVASRVSAAEISRNTIATTTAFVASNHLYPQKRRTFRTGSSMVLSYTSTTVGSSGSTVLTTSNVAIRAASSSATSSNETWENGMQESPTTAIDDLRHEEEETTAELASPIQQERELWLRSIQITLKTLAKKQVSLQNELKKVDSVSASKSRATLLKTYLYMFQQNPSLTSVTVQDWESAEDVELSLDPQYSCAAEEVDALFTQIRKLKRGSSTVRTLLEDVITSIQVLQDACTDLESMNDDDDDDDTVLRLVQDRLIRTSKQTQFVIPSSNDTSSSNNGNNKSSALNRQQRTSKSKKPELGTPASNVRKLVSDGGCPILVGRNRRGNEYLSISVARGNDIWMHARGTPGAHVVVQQRRGTDPTVTEECLQFAANVAAFYSDHRTERYTEITAAYSKHIQKPRGAPLGAVKVRTEWRTFVGSPDAVPDTLKEARAVSGVADDYRLTDKAQRRRKNTKQQQKQKKQKQKKQKQKKTTDGGSMDFYGT